MPTMHNEVSYCALYCGNCFIRKGDVTNRATELLQMLNDVNFGKWASGLAEINPAEMNAFKFHQECCDVLSAWDNMRCDKICREGGGSSECGIRDCCKQKGLQGCWECDEFQSCATLGALQKVNGNRIIQNILMIQKQGIEAFVSSIEKSPDCNFWYS